MHKRRDILPWTDSGGGYEWWRRKFLVRSALSLKNSLYFFERRVATSGGAIFLILSVSRKKYLLQKKKRFPRTTHFFWPVAVVTKDGTACYFCGRSECFDFIVLRETSF